MSLFDCMLDGRSMTALQPNVAMSMIFPGLSVKRSTGEIDSCAGDEPTEPTVALWMSTACANTHGHTLCGALQSEDMDDASSRMERIARSAIGLRSWS